MDNTMNRLWVKFLNPELPDETYKNFSQINFHNHCVELGWAGSPCRVVIPHGGVREFSTGNEKEGNT